MIGVYLLVSLFSQLPAFGIAQAFADVHVPLAVSVPSQVAAVTPPFSLIVDFPEINGLRPGSPVLVEGNLVGRVKQISSKQPSKSRQRGVRSFEVAIDLDSSVSEKLARGTCALQALPMTDSKSTRKPVVELFVPELALSTNALALLRPGDRIPGYASYEEFWRSGSERTIKRS